MKWSFHVIFILLWIPNIYKSCFVFDKKVSNSTKTVMKIPLVYRLFYIVRLVRGELFKCRILLTILKYVWEWFRMQLRHFNWFVQALDFKTFEQYSCLGPDILSLHSSLSDRYKCTETIYLSVFKLTLVWIRLWVNPLNKLMLEVCSYHMNSLVWVEFVLRRGIL